MRFILPMSIRHTLAARKAIRVHVLLNGITMIEHDLGALLSYAIIN